MRDAAWLPWKTKVVGSVSLAEEAEAGQYHLHEQIGEGACEWLPLERTRCPTATHSIPMDPLT